MIDDKTPLGWPLPHPGNDPFAVDVPRLRNALTLIDAAISAARVDLGARPTAATVDAKVKAAIDALKGNAPEALDTLVEIAGKLEDNDDAVAALVLQIATKAAQSDVDTTVADIRAKLAALRAFFPDLDVSKKLQFLQVKADGSGYQTTALDLSGAPDMPRVERNANTALVKADKGKLIDITSGTFVQTFQAVTTLGSGWWLKIRNSGTGDITLDPNGSETIDGRSSFIMYPGETRLIQCDGGTLRTLVLTPFYKVFTASDVFIPSPGYKAFEGLLWGGGGGGGIGTGGNQSFGGGGGGGACVPFVVDASSSRLFNPATVTIGGGGTGASSLGGAGTPGGTSSINSLVVAYGGGRGTANTGGGGGGALSAGNDNAGGAPGRSSDQFNLDNHGFGGGYGVGTQTQFFAGGNSFYGGGGGGSTWAGNGGRSVYGGGGGAGGDNGSGSNPQRGESSFGGDGGQPNGGNANLTNGAVPGGGGSGRSFSFGPAGNGARGELRIWGLV